MDKNKDFDQKVFSTGSNMNRKDKRSFAKKISSLERQRQKATNQQQIQFIEKEIKAVTQDMIFKHGEESIFEVDELIQKKFSKQ